VDEGLLDPAVGFFGGTLAGGDQEDLGGAGHVGAEVVQRFMQDQNGALQLLEVMGQLQDLSHEFPGDVVRTDAEPGGPLDQGLRGGFIHAKGDDGGESEGLGGTAARSASRSHGKVLVPDNPGGVPPGLLEGGSRRNRPEPNRQSPPCPGPAGWPG